MALAGSGWLIFLSPLAGHLSTYLKILGFLAEASLMLWLLIRGVNEQRWKAAGQRSAIRVTVTVDQDVSPVESWRR